jgi:hypothetical protein
MTSQIGQFYYPIHESDTGSTRKQLIPLTDSLMYGGFASFVMLHVQRQGEKIFKIAYNRIKKPMTDD